MSAVCVLIERMCVQTSVFVNVCPVMIMFRVKFWDDAENVYKVSLSALKPYAQHCLSRSMHVYSLSGQNIMAREKEICRLELDALDPAQLKNVSVCFSRARLVDIFF
jgi:hypothetical protein